MSRSLSDEQAESRFFSRNADELALLRRGIEMAVGGRFSLFVVEAPGAREINAALRWLKAQPALQGIEHIVVEAPPTRETPLDLLDPLGSGDVSRRVAHLRGIRADDTAFLGALNVQRDPLVQDLRLPLVLWVTKESHQALRDHAADFYDYRDAAFFLDGTSGLAAPFEILPAPGRKPYGSPDLQRRAAWLEKRLEDIERRGANSPADVRLRADLELELGQALLAQGALERAEALLQAAAERFGALGLGAREGDAVRAVGNLQEIQGRTDTALRYYDRALDLAERGDDGVGQGKALWERGRCLHDRGDFEGALVSYRRARDLFARFGAYPQDAIGLSVMMCRLLRDNGGLAEARRALDQVLAYCQKSRDRRGEALVRVELGQSLCAEGKPQAALRQFEQAVVLNRREKYDYGEAAASAAAAMVLLDQGQVGAARPHLRRAASLFTKVGEVEGAFAAIRSLAACSTPPDGSLLTTFAHECREQGNLSVANRCEVEADRLANLVTPSVARPQSAPSTHRKTGRNEPCPCGSGKKYKKCCLTNSKAESQVP